MNEFLLIAGMALVTFAIRYPVLAFVGRVPMPKSVLRSLGYVPPAVLAAIIAPAVLMPDGEHLAVGFFNPYLMAGLFSTTVAWRSRNLLLTIVAGMGFFWLWRWLPTLILASNLM
jgi:branched-subunit amino acid transport protein